MNIVDTASPKATVVARTTDGKIDFQAYIGLGATYEINDLNVEVEITDARTRFGHLDLLVQPRAGTGKRWVERKNLAITNDPATSPPVLAESTTLPETPQWVNTTAPAPTANVFATPVEETHTALADEVREIINRAALK